MRRSKMWNAPDQCDDDAIFITPNPKQNRCWTVTVAILTNQRIVAVLLSEVVRFVAAAPAAVSPVVVVWCHYF